MFTTAAAIFSLLLVVTGVAKIVRPGDVETALRELRLPVVRGTGLAIGIGELAIGVLGLGFQPLLAVQAVVYLAFAFWVGVALRLDVPIASCGCLGRDDTPPTAAHLGLNVIGALLSGLALLGDRLSIEVGLGGVAQILVIAVGVFLAYVVLADGARLEGVRAR